MLTDNILNLTGNTPLLRLKVQNIYAKAEFRNPGGSIKDRVALALLESAERDGRLQSDSIIVEPTSGNTGIGWPSSAGSRVIPCGSSCPRA